MADLDALIAALKQDEGFRGLLYDDATGKPLRAGDVIVGNPTIGYGWNVSDSPMSNTSATSVLVEKIIAAQKDAASLIPNWLLLDDVRQNVISNMSFNLGKTRLAKFVNFLSAVNDKRFVEAATHGRNSLWYKQVGKRAERLMQEMETGNA